MAETQLLLETFVELADTLVDSFDIADVLHTLTERSIGLLDVSAAGVMLTDQRGGLRVMASSSEQARLLELFELQHDEGPCVDCHRAGRAVGANDPVTMASRWPIFAAAAARAGFRSVQAVPLRLRAQGIGAFNLFRSVPGGLTDEQLRIGQALADIATIGLLQERAVHAATVLAEQLQGALNSRIRLEQAKGVLAARTGVDMDVAFRLMRQHARQHGRLLSDVAKEVIDGTVDLVVLA